MNRAWSDLVLYILEITQAGDNQGVRASDWVLMYKTTLKGPVSTVSQGSEKWGKVTGMDLCDLQMIFSNRILAKIREQFKGDLSESLSFWSKYDYKILCFYVS